MLDSAISQAAVFDIELRGNAVLNKLHEQLYELNSWAISNKEESFMKQLKEFEIVLNEAYNQCNNYSNELIDDYHARQYFRARVPIPVYHPILPHLKRCEPEEPTPTLQTQQMKPMQRERTFSDAVKYYSVHLAHFPDRPTTKSLGDSIAEMDKLIAENVDISDKINKFYDLVGDIYYYHTGADYSRGLLRDGYINSGLPIPTYIKSKLQVEKYNIIPENDEILKDQKLKKHHK